ncbi:hypothetical protein A4X13_0g7091 [Tilletia indica]|uniref:MULE transposase domain-containing protein n=1 Tax=Tilletia indica TaxID=43049 RepID=A0A177TLL3_9BASI|nr:hypothetical protein A4X13_0g7091 [Tilletia indica]
MVITPKTSAKEISQQLKHSKGYQAEKDAVYKAKSAILSEAYGDEVGSFKRLPAYVEQLQAADPGTHAVLELKDGVFKQVFVCPGACRLAGDKCRHWLAMDATLMKTKYEMRLNLAAAIDGTGSLILVGWALTPGETEDNWHCFMNNLRHSLSGLDGASNTVVSNRNAGLLSAIEVVLPDANSVYCCFHIAKNIKDRRYSAAAGRLFWTMVYARTKDRFDGQMMRLNEVDKEAAEYLEKIDTDKWATHAVKGRRYGHVTSNLAEIANAKPLEARELPPLLCLDYIYVHRCIILSDNLDAVWRRSSASLLWYQQNTLSCRSPSNWPAT